MNPEQLLKKAKAHISANKMRYILLLLSIVVWVNRKKIGAWLGFGDGTNDESHESVNDVQYADAAGNTTNVAISDGTRALIHRIKVAYVDSTSYLNWGNERCDIAQTLDQMSETQLATVARAYHAAYGKMLHAALYGVVTDPCKSAWSAYGSTLTLGLWQGAPTAYDSVLQKLQNLNIY